MSDPVKPQEDAETNEEYPGKKAKEAAPSSLPGRTRQVHAPKPGAKDDAEDAGAAKGDERLERAGRGVRASKPEETMAAPAERDEDDVPQPAVDEEEDDSEDAAEAEGEN